MPTQTKRHGFTLTEVLIATATFAIVATITIRAYCNALRDVKTCCSQINYTATGRALQQQLSRYVQNSRSAVVVSNTVTIFAASLTNYSCITFVDPDGNANTPGTLTFYLDGSTTNNGVVLSSSVYPIQSNTMFRIIPTTPCSVGFAFHIGGTTNTADAVNASYSGKSCAGIDMRFTSTPRNLMREYQ